MDFQNLQHLLAASGEPNYRFKQIADSICSGKLDYQEMTSLPRLLRETLTKKLPLYTWTASSILTSADGSLKAALVLTDGSVIETVLIQPKPGHWSVCISCEVGCPMHCAFCATGAQGFTRKLTAEEIVDQVLFWRSEAPDKPVASVVFMGMGEPFHNLESVLTAIGWINQYYGIGYRHLSVSTCGVPAGIQALAERFPQVNLAISLHSAMNPVRSSLMPINRQTDLTALAQSVTDYMTRTNRQVMFEYLLIHGLNDTREAADSLVEWLQQFPPALRHVNLIRYNDTGTSFQIPSKEQVYQFKSVIERQGISVTVRKSLGFDIAGACGQLAGKV